MLSGDWRLWKSARAGRSSGVSGRMKTVSPLPRTTVDAHGDSDGAALLTPSAWHLTRASGTGVTSVASVRRMPRVWTWQRPSPSSRTPNSISTPHPTGIPSAPVASGRRLPASPKPGLLDAVEFREPRLATVAELERVHSPAYVAQLERFCERGGGDLDPDTFAAPGSWSTALRAAGAVLDAVDALEAGSCDVAFAAGRPPGHHAVPDRAMGFCLVNNVAVAAAQLAEAGQRVAIVDWDVHHGNGTQDIFYDDPNVLYVSTHEYPLYPGSGRADETGGPACADVEPQPAVSGRDARRRLPACGRRGDRTRSSNGSPPTGCSSRPVSTPIATIRWPGSS